MTLNRLWLWSCCLVLLGGEVRAAEPKASAWWPGAGIELAVGAGAAAVSVPLTWAAAAWLGTLSPTLLGAALPAVLLFAALPPLAVTFAVWWASAALSGRPGHFSPAVWLTLAVHVLVTAGAVLLGADGQLLGDVLLFTAAEALLLPATALVTMRLGAPRSLPLLTVRF